MNEMEAHTYMCGMAREREMKDEKIVMKNSLHIDVISVHDRKLCHTQFSDVLFLHCRL